MTCWSCTKISWGASLPRMPWITYSNLWIWCDSRTRKGSFSLAGVCSSIAGHRGRYRSSHRISASWFMIPTIFLLGTSWAFSVAWVRHQQNLMPAKQPLQQSLENPNQQKLLFCHCSAYIKSHPNMLESFAICDCFEPPFVVKKWLYLVASIGWRVEPFLNWRKVFSWNHQGEDALGHVSPSLFIQI